MENQVEKIFKAFKEVKPEEGFVQRSRQIIMATEQKPMRFGLSLIENLKIASALALASALLFIALGGIAFLSKPGSSAVFTAEDSNKAFHIQLGEASYGDGQEAEVGINLDEILKNLSL